MDGYLLRLLLHGIPFVMLGWLSCEVFLRNPKHFLNRTAALMFTLMMMQFGVAYLDQSFPVKYAVGYMNAFEIIPSIILTLGIMLFIRQMTARTAKTAYSLLDLSLIIPVVAMLLVVLYPDVYGISMHEEGGKASFVLYHGGTQLFIGLTIICWGYGALNWLRGWMRLRSVSSSPPSRILIRQAGFALLGGGGLTIVAMILDYHPLYPADFPSLSLFAWLLFSFFIRRAMLHYGFMPSIMEKYRILFALSPFGVLLMDREGIIREANPVVLMLFGIPAEELQGRSLTDFLNRAERFSLTETGSGQQELDLIDNQGQWKRVILYINELFSEADGLYYVVLQDVTERRKAEKEIAYLAYHDSLTGLGNRLQFRESIDTLLGEQGRGALLLLDLDRFKMVNDKHGHQAGDTLLRDIAACLLACIPASGRICRIGGDEFAVLLPEAGDSWDPEHTAACLLQGLTGQHGKIDANSPVTVSIGIAIWPRDASDSQALLHAADVAMYRAKQHGRNRYEVFAGHGDSLALLS